MKLAARDASCFEKNREEEPVRMIELDVALAFPGKSMSVEFFQAASGLQATACNRGYVVPFPFVFPVFLKFRPTQPNLGASNSAFCNSTLGNLDAGSYIT